MEVNDDLWNLSQIFIAAFRYPATVRSRRDLVRRFLLQNPEFAVPSSIGLAFGWSELESELAYQIAFQEQLLYFYKHLFSNLQSVSTENPDWRPLPLSLSLRAGAIKTYVLLGVSIAEGALFGLAVRRGFGLRVELRRRTFGQLLGVWSEIDEPRDEIREIWEELQLLLTYRNYIHLANAAGNERAYWQDTLDHEDQLVEAVERVVNFSSNLSSGQNGA